MKGPIKPCNSPEDVRFEGNTVRNITPSELRDLQARLRERSRPAIAPRIHVDLVASSYLLFAALFAGLTVLFYVTDCQQALARGHVHALAGVTAVFALCGLAIVRTARPGYLSQDLARDLTKDEPS